MTVCVLHGGASPLAKQAATRLLLSMVEPAVTTLFKAIESCKMDPLVPLRCLTHGDDGCPEWPARINAAKALLDRSGHGPQAKLLVSDDTTDLRRLPRAQLAAELESLSAEIRSNMSDDEHDVIDMEPIEPRDEARDPQPEATD